jgi:hypothetical protein
MFSTRLAASVLKPDKIAISGELEISSRVEERRISRRRQRIAIDDVEYCLVAVQKRAKVASPW